MITKTKKEVLRTISKKLGNKVYWCLVGGTNLERQGVNVSSRDIDLLTSKAGAYRIGKLLKEYEIEPVHLRESKKLVSHHGKFIIKSIEIEVIGEVKIKNIYRTANESKLLMLKIDDFKIPRMALESEYEAYLRLGRKEKAGIIRQKLKTIS